MKKDSLEKKIAAYVTLAAAYLAAHPVDADAQIMYTDVNPDLVIHNSYFNLDLNNDGVTDFKLQQTIPWAYSYCSTLEFEEKAICLNGARLMGHCYDVGYLGGYGYFASNLQAGQPINAWQYFNNYPTFNRYHDRNCPASGVYNTYYSIGCVIGDNQLVGVKVIHAGNNYYGWMRVNVHSGEIVLKDYAIHLTPNASIQAGVIPTCPKPVNLSSVSINNHSQKLLWNIQGTSIGYKVRVRITGTTTWTNVNVNGNIGFKQIYGLTPNTTYDWQVRSFCSLSPLVQSVFTNTLTFTTPVRMEDEVVDAGATEIQNELFIYPNPAGNEIHLLIGNEGNYEIKIYNMLGQVVSDEKINLAADQIVTINTSQLSAGPYQIVATSNEGNIIGRFVKE